MKRIIISILMITGALGTYQALSCTGITLQTADSLTITARTIEWAAEPLNAMLVVVPRGQEQRSMLPEPYRHGKPFVARYGYVGIAVENDAFVMEGINEVGLAAGLFYFPDYGEYPPLSTDHLTSTINDMQFVAWLLSSFATIDDMLAQHDAIRVCNIDPRSSTVHWRVTEPSGRQIILEIIDQRFVIYEDPLGVLTNSPEYTWHITNLNNYVNLLAGSVPRRQIGDLELKAFGGGSGLHGLPGDMTPPSRFIRAAIFQSTAPRLPSTTQTIVQAFHILNNFDIPVGIQFSDPDLAPNMPSATQITIATDLQVRRLYFRTMYNCNIRCVDLNSIDFDRVAFQVHPLDVSRDQPIQTIEIY